MQKVKAEKNNKIETNAADDDRHHDEFILVNGWPRNAMEVVSGWKVCKKNIAIWHFCKTKNKIKVESKYKT